MTPSELAEIKAHYSAMIVLGPGTPNKTFAQIQQLASDLAALVSAVEQLQAQLHATTQAEPEPLSEARLQEMREHIRRWLTHDVGGLTLKDDLVDAVAEIDRLRAARE